MSDRWRSPFTPFLGRRRSGHLTSSGYERPLFGLNNCDDIDDWDTRPRPALRAVLGEWGEDVYLGPPEGSEAWLSRCLDNGWCAGCGRETSSASGFCSQGCEGAFWRRVAS